MKTKEELRKEGFKAVPGFGSLFINRTGQVYDYRVKRFLPRRPQNQVVRAGKFLSVPKLLLSAFDKQPYNRNRQIRYIDGNKTNLQATNLCYPLKQEELKINYADLYKAIRCYMPVPKRYKIADKASTRIYLIHVVTARRFLPFNNHIRGIEIFTSYINNPLSSVQEIAHQNAISRIVCTEIVNTLIKQLIREILADLEAGKVEIKDFQPRPKTNAQVIREYNETLKKHGIEPIKIPRRKSTAQLLKDWDRHIEVIKQRAKDPE